MATRSGTSTSSDDGAAARPLDARSSRSRELLIATAERLFAENGIAAVSNRRISEEAGQGNNSAVAYHFGSKLGLVRAVARRHSAPIEQRRLAMVAGLDGSAGARDWVDCLVRPKLDHLDSLPGPTGYGRFVAHAMADPASSEVIRQDALASGGLAAVIDGLAECHASLPAEVRAERADMASRLLVHVVAERESAIADRRSTSRRSWSDTATGLVDAITGLWLAPWTPTPISTPNLASAPTPTETP